MFCPNCGGQLPNDAVFCGACGTRVNARSSVSPTPMVSPACHVKPAVPMRRIGKKVSRVGAAMLSVALLAALAFFSLTSCADIEQESYESAHEVSTALNEATSAFLASERTDVDQVKAIAAVASMMPEGIAENYIESLGYKSADEAIEELGEEKAMAKIIENLGSLEITFKPNSGNSLSRDSIKYYQNALEDLGLDGSVEEMIPLSAKIKATQSAKAFGMTRGDTNTVSSTPFYAMKVDDEWYLWVTGIEFAIESLDWFEW